MANPWDADPVIGKAPAQAAAPPAGGNPWADDPIIDDGGPGLEIDIRGGTPVPAKDFDPYAPAAAAGPAPKASLFRMDSDFRKRSGVGIGDMFWAAAKDTFGSDKGVAEYLAEQSGGKVEQDQQGDFLVALPDGTRYRINDPGLDSTDIAKFGSNALAFLTPAGWVTKLGQARNVGLVGRSALQAGAAGATDVALQAGFDDGRIDPGRASAATAGGGLGEVAGTALAAGGQRVMNALRSTTGANLEAARNMLADAGLPWWNTESVSRLARAQNEVQAGANPNALLGRDEFGLTYTQGQRMLDPERQFRLLSQEEVLRQSPMGGTALREAERRNMERVGEALEGIGTRLGRRPGATPAELAEGAATRLRGQAEELSTRIGEAYERAGQGGRTAIGAAAVRSLPDRLQAAVSEFSPNPSLTPAASKTLDQIRQATANILQSTDGANVRGVTLRALETQRRILNNNIGAAANPTDRAATTAIKREFDRWLDEAVDTALVSGDAQAIAAIKEARGLRAEFGRRFEGGADSDRFIAGLLDGTRTPEELVNIALGASQVSKAGAARFVQRLKEAAANDPDVIGQLRAAHFLRMTQDARGNPLPFGKLISNIRQTEYNNASVMRALYSKEQWNEIRRLAAALEPLVAKGDFARTSGTAERLARMLFQKFGDFPLVGGVIKTVGGIQDAIRANRALNQPLRLPARSPAIVPASGASALSEVSR